MIAPYWQSEAHGIALYHGDAWAIVPELPRPDHVISDPPYGERTKKGARSTRRTQHLSDDAHELGAPIVPWAVSAQSLRDLCTLVSARRWSLLFCDYIHAACLDANPPSGLRHLRTAPWVKPNGAPQLSGDRPAHSFETIACLHADGACRWNSHGKRGVYEHLVVANAVHPNEKPQPLLRKLMCDFTDRDELIADPFAGSSAHLLAALSLGRRAWGVELEERWCEVGAKRLEDAIRQGVLFEARPEPTQMELVA